MIVGLSIWYSKEYSLLLPPDFLSRGNDMNEYVIPFKGLDAGSHNFEFKIGKAFFESFEYFEAELGNIRVNLEMIKETTLLDLHFRLDGIISLPCDRCLEIIDYPVKGEFRLIIKFGESYHEETDEIVVIPLMESRIDLRQYLFEYINLMLPIKRVHEDESLCNPIIIDKLEQYSKPETDPRWDALKKINLK